MRHLLMLHGWGFPSAVFDALYEELATDYAVERPDRPGYGNRADHPGNETGSDASVRLASPAMVVGWSLGGIEAMQLALRQPDMVTGLVLMAATPCFVNRNDWQAGMPQATFDAFRSQVADDPAAAMRQFVRLNAAAKADRHVRETLSKLSDATTSPALISGLDELENTDLRDVIKDITCPVFLMHAADDRVMPLSASHWLQRQLTDSRLSEFSSGGHAFFLQHSSEVADQIRAFQ